MKTCLIFELRNTTSKLTFIDSTNLSLEDELEFHKSIDNKSMALSMFKPGETVIITLKEKYNVFKY